MEYKNFLKENKNRTILIAAILASLSLVAVIFSFILTDNLQDKIAVNQLKMISDRIESDNSALYDELGKNLTLIASLYQSDVFSQAQNNQWGTALGTILQSNKNISAISVIGPKGGEYFAAIKDSVLSYYFLGNESSLETTLFEKRLNSESVTSIDTIILQRAIELDSYKEHKNVAPDSVVWYKIQPLPGAEKNIGLAASIKTIKKETGEDAIITLYISLYKTYNFLREKAGAVNAELFLFTRNGRFLDLNNTVNKDSISNIADYLTDRDSIKSPFFKQIITSWEKVEKGDTIQISSFKFQKHKYWGVYRGVQQKTNNLVVALVIPEDDFIVVLKSKMGVVFFVPILILLISITVLIILFRAGIFRKNSDGLPDDLSVLKLIENGENEYVEFKSTIRVNLFTDKPGKEIELAWLKSVVGFCNSKGGTIFIGVDDNGEILGLEADKFPNDDKCLLHVQNLLRDHIGMEFSDYINYRFYTVDEKKILAVHCRPAPKPLFLTSNNKEQFFVRSGPASIELPISKALKYIEDRKSK